MLQDEYGTPSVMRNVGMSMELLARAYDIELVESASKAGNDLLITTGAGLMMAMFDLCPSLRWGVDIGGNRKVSSLGSFIDGASYIGSWPSKLVVHLWIGLAMGDRGKKIQQGAVGWQPWRVFWRCNVPFYLMGRECDTMQELVDAVNGGARE